MQRKKKRKAISALKDLPFYKKYNFELTVLLLLFLGIFLILEKMEIKYYMYLGIRKFFFFIGEMIKFFYSSILFILKQFETSDLVGIILILLALMMILSRWRQRIIERNSILLQCKNCGGSLKRVTRKLRQHIIARILLAEVKRYRCNKCEFIGLKISYKRNH